MAADPLHYVVASLGDYASGLSEAIATYRRMHGGGCCEQHIPTFSTTQKYIILTAQERDSMVSPAISGASCNKKGNMAFVSFQLTHQKTSAYDLRPPLVVGLVYRGTFLLEARRYFAMQCTLDSSQHYQKH